MPEKDDAGIYYFDYGDGNDTELLKEVIYLRALVEELKNEIAQLKNGEESNG